jgi:hypothetical protein
VVTNRERYSPEAAEKHANGFRALLGICLAEPGRICTRFAADAGAVDRHWPEGHIPASAGHPPHRASPETVRHPCRAETPHALEPPQTSSELAIARIWSEVLRRADLSRSDDFFDLGGHSLLATQVCSRVNAEFGVDLPLRTAFEARSLAAIARAVDEARTQPLRRAARPHIEPLAPLDLSACRIRRSECG